MITTSSAYRGTNSRVPTTGWNPNRWWKLSWPSAVPDVPIIASAPRQCAAAMAIAFR